VRIAIATVQIPFIRGGAEAHAEGLKDALIAAGHEADIVTFPFNPVFPERIPDQMLAARLINLTEIHGQAIDLLIALKFPAYLIPHPNKVVWLLHQHRAAYDFWSYPFEDLDASPQGVVVREAIRRADQQLLEARAIFANSKTVANRLKHFCGIESTPLPHPPPGAEAFHCADAGDYFFFPSRLSASKRQSLVIEALAFTTQPVRVRFAGVADSPDYGKRLQKLVRRLDLESRVEWLGFLSEQEKREQYARAIAVLFPPVDEDYGYVTLEAMLSSKAVITCEDSGGPLEFVMPNRTGLVSEPSASALAQAMDTLWSDRELARQFGREGCSRYGQLGISWRNVVARLVA